MWVPETEDAEAPGVRIFSVITDMAHEIISWQARFQN